MPSLSCRGLSPPNVVSVDGPIGNSVSTASLDWLSIGWPPASRPSLSVEYTSDASASVPDVAVSEARRSESAAGGSPKSATDSPGAAITESEVAPDSSPAGLMSAAASTPAPVSTFVGAVPAPDVASSFACALAGCGGVYGALGRAACQSASALPRNLRAATAATPTSAARMANLVSHRLFFLGG